MITFVLWKWRQLPAFREVYSAAHVNAMVSMIARHVAAPHRIVCITDDPAGVACETFPLWRDLASLRNASGSNMPSCYRRLRIFDGATTDAMGIQRGERVVSVDIDGVIVSPAFGRLFERPEPFVGWMVPGHRHLRTFQGSMFMFKAGALGHLWSEFDQAASPKQTAHRGFLGSDQAWISMRMIDRPDVGGWNHQRDGVKRLRHIREERRFSERDTCVVFFPGYDKPWHPEVRRKYPWIDRHASYEDDEESVA